ncbi:hypothetical protein BDV93DRAFT_548135 [Ceratobasidium sp. AG-I]|nr:hypothetical protein BDV93DRAFT_548135 [Ceratobasidium sp. AG-I]
MPFNRRGFPCPSLRQIYLAHAYTSLVGWVGYIGFLWYQFYYPGMVFGLTPTRNSGLELVVLTVVMFNLVRNSVDGLNAVISGELSQLKFYRNMSWMILFIWSTLDIFLLSPTASILDCTEKLSAKVIYEGSDPQENSVAEKCRKNITNFYTGLVLFGLVNLYWCILLSRYVRQVAAGEDKRRDDIALDIEEKGVEIKPPTEKVQG